jgi:hypothetical protein
MLKNFTVKEAGVFPFKKMEGLRKNNLDIFWDFFAKIFHQS